MRLTDIAPIFMVFVAFVLLGVSIYFFMESNTLQKQNSDLAQNLGITSTALNSTKNALTITTNELNKKNTELQETNNLLAETTLELVNAKAQLEEKTKALSTATTNIAVLEEKQKNLTKAMNALKTELSDVETTINDSISWFKENAYFSNSFLQKGNMPDFIDAARNDCVKYNEINLACLTFMMDKKLDFKYILEAGDRLYSLDEIVNNKGGDCEDFSIFAKALLNYLNEYYENANELMLNAWAYRPGSEYIIFSDAKNRWYMPNAEEYKIGDLKELRPAVFCYTVKCTGEACEGHCVVGFSKTKINDIEDISNLSDTIMYEPQNGQYLGGVGLNYEICNKYISKCDKKPNHVWLIIGDDDLYIFKDNAKWAGYKYYLKKVNALRNETNA